ncbi:helix-turn-helix domain-containing protein [Methylobacterium planeticum]|uniref:Helix-turn-helix transcriptional regulator n=1 Tax=Methylobacterium planeticum TaxID=2615211 RepID=A0A6N6MPT9_9HYPH|nr:helix-turn-helix transcriptional regulator [Methylobacterium planeticum]KAB1073404.1 helix-turn-helix transcriptional regulator [Methylobacterium planeticum]
MAGQKTDQRDAYIGQRIAEERRRASLTQRRVAQSFGMSAAQLQKYEKGTNRISAVHLEILARMTGVPIEHFFQGMKRLDDIPLDGFGENRQQPYSGESEWQGLVEVVARHVDEHFSEGARRDLAAAVHALDRKLNG